MVLAAIVDHGRLPTLWRASHSELSLGVNTPVLLQRRKLLQAEFVWRTGKRNQTLTSSRELDTQNLILLAKSNTALNKGGMTTGCSAAGNQQYQCKTSSLTNDEIRCGNKLRRHRSVRDVGHMCMTSPGEHDAARLLQLEGSKSDPFATCAAG
jgi:hypothetical protein